MPRSLRIQPIPGGPLQTNAVLVIDADSRQALLIDAPPGTHDTVTGAVRDADVTVKTIVLTHTHWDHIVDANTLRDELGAPILAHPKADARLAKPGSAVMQLPFTIAPVTPDGHLEEGDQVVVGAHTFDVLFLPGHDPSHIVLYSEAQRALLGGDVLFPGGHGRTDLPDADHE
ncbi:MAG: MBL fold metallo-hydrolase, partial [Chloroflexota bacterium]|nr:MBL fold metallo-hydrolase [Chloroflexota bacterium]